MMTMISDGELQSQSVSRENSTVGQIENILIYAEASVPSLTILVEAIDDIIDPQGDGHGGKARWMD